MGMELGDGVGLVLGCVPKDSVAEASGGAGGLVGSMRRSKIRRTRV